MKLTSRRPYLIRAMYEWLVDNELTPHLIVDIYAPGVEVPQQEANQDGRLVLNISMRAVKNLELGNRTITFDARFSGVAHHLVVPVSAVLAIYARENNQGLAFPDATDLGVEEPDDATQIEAADTPKPAGLSLAATRKDIAEADSAIEEQGPESSGDDSTKPKKRGRAQLKVVK